MRKAVLSLLAFLAMAGSTGCTELKVYGRDRALDLWDCFGLGVTFGDGILANARVTKLVQAGYGFYHVQKAGFFGRQMGLWEEKRLEQGLSIFYLNSFQKRGLSGNYWFWRFMGKYPTEIYDDDADLIQFYDRHWEDVGVTVHILKMGVDVVWRNIEFFDFLAGIFTIDISWDDTWWEEFKMEEKRGPFIRDEVY